MIRSLMITTLVAISFTTPALAEESGDIQAMLARQLFIEGNDAEAFTAAKALAEKGVPRAQAILGFFYERGIGVASDPAQAVVYYQKAAANGNPTGLHNLASSYENGELGLTKDLEKARALYAQAAEMDYGASVHNLARMYLYGTGGPKDAAVARALFERAIALGAPEATADYAYILAVGDGFPVDLPKARKLYGIAAAQGIDWAMRDYGEMQELGEGGLVDLAEAEEWYRLAQAEGNVMAGFDIAEMIWANSATMGDRKVEALAWCYWAEANGPDAEGTDYTGKCIEPGLTLSPEERTAATEMSKTF